MHPQEGRASWNCDGEDNLLLLPWSQVLCRLGGIVKKCSQLKTDEVLVTRLKTTFLPGLDGPFELKLAYDYDINRQKSKNIHY